MMIISRYVDCWFADFLSHIVFGVAGIVMDVVLQTLRSLWQTFLV